MIAKKWSRLNYRTPKNVPQAWKPGTFSTVWIDEAGQFIKKSFLNEGTVGHEVSRLDQDFGRSAFKTEIEITRQLEEYGSKYFVPILEFDESELSFIQPFLGHDLLLQKSSGTIPPTSTFENQLIDIYREYRELDFFKFNGNLVNFTLSEGVLKAFDFKWSGPRKSEHANYELHSFVNWLKHDFPIPINQIVSSLLEEFPELAMRPKYKIFDRANLIDVFQAKNIESIELQFPILSLLFPEYVQDEALVFASRTHRGNHHIVFFQPDVKNVSCLAFSFDGSVSSSFFEECEDSITNDFEGFYEAHVLLCDKEVDLPPNWSQKPLHLTLKRIQEIVTQAFPELSKFDLRA